MTTTMSPKTLLPCPFCNSTPYDHRAVNGSDVYVVGCASCGFELKAAWYRGEPAPTKDILSLWNQRASSSDRTPTMPSREEPVDGEVNAARSLIEQWAWAAARHFPETAEARLDAADKLAKALSLFARPVDPCSCTPND